MIKLNGLDASSIHGRDPEHRVTHPSGGSHPLEAHPEQKGNDFRGERRSAAGCVQEQHREQGSGCGPDGPVPPASKKRGVLLW